jgi:biotin carboxylase
MSKAGWRERKRKKNAIELTRKQLAIVQECITAVRTVLETASNDPSQLLTVASKLDALLRRQDRLQRVIESAPSRSFQEQAAKPATANAELEAKLAQRGLLTFTGGALGVPHCKLDSQA